MILMNTRIAASVYSTPHNRDDVEERLELPFRSSSLLPLLPRPRDPILAFSLYL